MNARTMAIAFLLSLSLGAYSRAQDSMAAAAVAEFQQALAEFDDAQAIRSTQPVRARQLFRQAAQRFRSVRNTGIVSGELEFNLGNCYLQAGDVGKSIVHYRRAQRLIPGNAMLEDNLSVARSRCVTSIKPTRRSAVVRSLLFWHFQTSRPSRLRAALFFYIMFWGLLTLRNVVPRRAVVVGAIVCACGALSVGTSVAVDRWADRNVPAGVVTAMDVVVRKGPGDGFQRLFEQPLQSGVEFTLREKHARGWWKVELADGKTGWIEAHQAELVPVGGVNL